MKNSKQTIENNRKRNLRVLQLGKFYPIRGGVEKVMYDLMLGLSARGIDCDMLCAAEKGGSRKITINAHAELICSHTWFKYAATMISPALIVTLCNICRRYDIIHIHHPDPFACLALFLSRYKGKVVLHWHSDILQQQCLLKIYRPLQNWLLRRADVVVGTTPVYLAESPYLTNIQNKAVCLPIGINPITVDSDRAEKLKRHYNGKKIIFSLGRLIPYKGYGTLIEAAQFLSDDYIILIGGTGPLKGELSADIKRRNLSGKVELLGFVSDEELPGYYGACDVFCLSSMMKTEAFGIVQIEAMSCGKPVVATQILQSGVSWVNAHGVSGINVPPGDPKALAEAIMEITASQETYYTYSQQAKKRFCSEFTIEQMILRCLDMYHSLFDEFEKSYSFRK